MSENVNDINTRLHDGPVFNVIHPNVESVKRSVWYGGSIEWNSLDAEIRNIVQPEQYLKEFKNLGCLIHILINGKYINTNNFVYCIMFIDTMKNNRSSTLIFWHISL